MTRQIFTILLFISFASLNCSKSQVNNSTFRTGSDVLLLNDIKLISGKKISLVVNHTSVLSNGIHLLDTLLNRSEVKIVSVFSPEHGFAGNFSAGEKIKDSVSSDSGIKFYSLYGKTFKPAKEMLTGTDLILFDLQDIGARFYTYISTLFYVLQSAAENNIPVIVLDRPNPYSGNIVGGPLIEKSLQSFIGITSLPVLHGMTIGELAKYFSEEEFLGKGLKTQLHIIKMENWKREYFLDDIDLKWINPSPNIKSFETIIIYPATCLIEGTNISEGRGTEKPFLQIGAPFINSEKLISELTSSGIKEIEIIPAEFTPKSIKGVAESPKYEGQKCFGISFKVINKKIFDAVKFGIQLISALVKLYPKDFRFREDHFDKLVGVKNIRQMITGKRSVETIVGHWMPGLNEFKERRNKYLLY